MYIKVLKFLLILKVVDAQIFGDILAEHGITYFTGVPDSILQPWVNYLNSTEKNPHFTHIQAVNECEAIALTSGYNLGTRKIGMVYMQNSGLGKAVNPLTSLADPEVYSIPILLLIGWRGEPGKPDDPQHLKMGKIMLHMLDCLEIPYQILTDDPKDVRTVISHAVSEMKSRSAPYALICQKNFFDSRSSVSENEYNQDFSSEDVISTILEHTTEEELLFSNTGQISRALHHLRNKRKENIQDFFTLGSMGCVSSIALGVAQHSSKSVIVLDGDGAMLMQLGALATIGHQRPKNYIHILFDNNGYCSTGCQPTISNTIDFGKIAEACGYNFIRKAQTKDEFEKYFQEGRKIQGPSLIVVQIRRTRKKYVARLQDPHKYKKNFQEKLQGELES